MNCKMTMHRLAAHVMLLGRLQIDQAKTSSGGEHGHVRQEG